MNDILQPGQHPDADQLSAFVEHALPIHEQQQTLAHLATCADCRAIVYLAEPAALEKPAQTQTIAARKPWIAWNLFSGWNLVWPAAAALACLIVLTVHLRNATLGKSQPITVSTAHLEQTPPALSQAPPPEPAVSPNRASATIQTKQAIVTNKVGAAGIAATGTAGSIGGMSERKSSDRALEGRGRAGLAIPGPELGFTSTATLGRESSAGPMPAASLQTASPAPASPSSGGPFSANPSPPPALSSSSVGRLQLRSAASQYNAAVVPAQPAPPPAPPEAAAGSAHGIYAGTGQNNLNENYVEGVPLSNVTTRGDSLSQAKAVSAGAAFAAAGGAAPAQAKQLPTLPSKLAAISVATDARQELAVDGAGTVFRSEDAGVTWQAVPAQWTGRAVKVSIIGAASREMVAKKAGALTSSTAALKRPESAPAAVFELNTATGEVWISADGQTWKRK